MQKAIVPMISAVKIIGFSMISCPQFLFVNTIECTLCEHSIVMNMAGRIQPNGRILLLYSILRRTADGATPYFFLNSLLK